MSVFIIILSLVSIVCCFYMMGAANTRIFRIQLWMMIAFLAASIVVALTQLF